MRTSGRVFLLAAAFSAAVGIAYWFSSHEPAGSVMLAFMAAAPALAGAYILRRARRATDASDDPEARPEEAAGEVVGTFPSASLWPIVLAAGLLLVTAGLAFWPWLFVLGGAIAVGAAAGLMRESRG